MCSYIRVCDYSANWITELTYFIPSIPTKLLRLKFISFNTHLYRKHCTQITLYAVKVQTSLAPLSWFPGSRVPTAHVHQCCRFQSYAKTVPSRMKLTTKLTKREPTFLGSMTMDHARDHGVWRLTLTAYRNVHSMRFQILELHNNIHV